MIDGIDDALLEHLRKVDFRKLEERLLYHAGRKQDIHKISYALAFDVPLESVTPEQRRIGKALTVAVMYTFNCNIDRAERVRRLLNGTITITGRKAREPEMQIVRPK